MSLHVSLLADLRAGKPCTGEAVAAIEGLERDRAALIAALIDAASAFDAIATPPERLNGGYDHYALVRQVAARAATAIREQMQALD